MAKTILLLEDDLDLQRIYSTTLSHHGFEVLLAADTSQALNLLNEKKPNLILLDIMLPGKMNGLEFLERIKVYEDLKNIPVIVITNLDTQKESALKVGAADYLVKANLDLHSLVEKVNKFI